MRIEILDKKGYDYYGLLQEHNRITYTCESKADIDLMIKLDWGNAEESPYKTGIHIPFFKHEDEKYHLIVKMILDFIIGDKALALVSLRSSHWEISDTANLLIHAENVKVIR